jgi:hypothetical protein
MQHDASGRNDHPGAKFQQPLAERPNLCARAAGAGGSQAQLLHQHVGRDSQQHAELVGPEASATGAVDVQLVEFLDALMRFSISPRWQ